MLISEAVLARLPRLPEGIAAEALGAYQLRGRSETMIVHALADGRKPRIVGAPAAADADRRVVGLRGSARPRAVVTRSVGPGH